MHCGHVTWSHKIYISFDVDKYHVPYFTALHTSMLITSLSEIQHNEEADKTSSYD